MASIHRRPASKYWHAFFRDSDSRRFVKKQQMQRNDFLPVEPNILGRSQTVARKLDRSLQPSSRSSKPAGDSKSLFATTSAQSCQGWATFQSTESPNSRPPPGRPATNRRSPAKWLVRRYFSLKRKLVKLVACCRLGFVNASESLLR